MNVFLALICLHVQTPDSIPSSCTPLTLHDTRQAARDTLSLFCADDDDCLARATVWPMRIQDSQIEFVTEAHKIWPLD